jgi:hypothetical protein
MCFLSREKFSRIWDGEGLQVDGNKLTGKKASPGQLLLGSTSSQVRASFVLSHGTLVVFAKIWLAK